MEEEERRQKLTIFFYKPRYFLCETRDMNIEPPNIENLVLLCVRADQAVLGSTETAH